MIWGLQLYSTYSLHDSDKILKGRVEIILPEGEIGWDVEYGYVNYGGGQNTAVFTVHDSYSAFW